MCIYVCMPQSACGGQGRQTVEIEIHACTKIFLIVFYVHVYLCACHSLHVGVRATCTDTNSLLPLHGLDSGVKAWQWAHLPSVLVCCHLLYLNTDQSSLGRKELCHLTDYSPSLRDVRVGTQAGHELIQKPLSIAAYWLAPRFTAGYLPMDGW